MTTNATNLKSGYYLDTSRWTIAPVEVDGGSLPAGSWRRIPTLVALLATPVLGLAFVIALPFIGFALTLRAALSPAAALAAGSAGELAATMHPGFTPGEAHLTGRDGAGASDADDALDALEGEIDEKRHP